MTPRSTGNETSERRSAPVFYEIVIRGPQNLCRGLLTGLRLGAAHEAVVFDGPGNGVAPPSLGERTRELLHLRPHENHCLVDNQTRKLLARRAGRIEDETGLEFVSDRRIRKAAFDYRYAAYARDYDREIQETLDGLPEGLDLVNRERDETIADDAKGPEGYAPLHDYEVEGSGTIRGRLDRVIAARRRLDAHPLIEVGAIELELSGD